MKYKVLKDTRLGGKFVKAGDIVEYSAKDQGYLRFGGIIELVEVEDKPVKQAEEKPVDELSEPLSEKPKLFKNKKMKGSNE